MTIWKFPIEITDEQRVLMPFGAKPLHAGLDPAGLPCIWAQVDAGNSAEALTVFVVGTGHPIPAFAHSYVGSFNQGPFVWHIYTGV